MLSREKKIETRTLYQSEAEKEHIYDTKKKDEEISKTMHFIW